MTNPTPGHAETRALLACLHDNVEGASEILMKLSALELVELQGAASVLENLARVVRRSRP